MCRRPVTFGGGSNWTKRGPTSSPSRGVGTRNSPCSTQKFAHFSSIREGSYAFGSSELISLKRSRGRAGIRDQGPGNRDQGSAKHQKRIGKRLAGVCAGQLLF